MDGKEAHPKLLGAAEHTETAFQDARELRGIRKREGQIEIRVEWDGLPDVVDLTWEPLETVQEDQPQILDYFLRTAGDRKWKPEALAQCFSQ